MAKRMTLIMPDQVYEVLRQIAAANEDSLSGVASTSVRTLDWILKQQREGYVVKAEKDFGDKIVMRELIIDAR